MNSAQARLPIGHRVAGRYQVAALLGAGEMGEVYDVRDVTTGYAYALKLLAPELLHRPEAWDSYRQATQRASTLDVEAVVKTYGTEVEPQLGAPYALGEFVTIPSLHAHVLSQGPLSVAALEAIIRAVATSLDKVHAAGIVHRALKPQNLFAAQADARSWHVRISDFGIADARLLAPPPPGWTATPGWLSAEQANPQTAASPSMDIYALGLVAFFALTGRSIFLSCRSTPPDLTTLWAEMTAPLPSASQRARELGVPLSPTLDPWFARALAVSPAQRFTSAGEMALALGALVSASQAPRPGAGGRGLKGTLLLDSAQQAAGYPGPVSSDQASGTVDASQAPTTSIPSPEPSYGAPPAQQPPQQQPASAFGQPQPVSAYPESAPVQSSATSFSTNPSAADTTGPRKKTGSSLVLPLAIGAGVLTLGVLATAGWWFATRWNRPAIPAVDTSVPVASASTEPAPSASVAQQEPTAAATQSAAPSAETPPAPPATNALVTFQCDPDCEQVKCDNKVVEDLVAGVRLEAGKHTCVAVRGRTRKSDTIEVKAGEDTSHTFTMAKPASAAPPATTPPAHTAPPARTTTGTPPTAPPAKTCGTFLNPCKK